MESRGAALVDTSSSAKLPTAGGGSTSKKNRASGRTTGKMRWRRRRRLLFGFGNTNTISRRASTSAAATFLTTAFLTNLLLSSLVVTLFSCYSSSTPVAVSAATSPPAAKNKKQAMDANTGVGATRKWGQKKKNNNKEKEKDEAPSFPPSDVPSMVPSTWSGVEERGEGEEPGTGGGAEGGGDDGSTAAMALSTEWCNICGGEDGDSNVVGSPESEVQDPVSGDRVTCAVLQDRANGGAWNPLQCRIVQVSVFEACGCRAGDGGDAGGGGVGGDGGTLGPSTSQPTTEVPDAADADEPTTSPTTVDSVPTTASTPMPSSRNSTTGGGGDEEGTLSPTSAPFAGPTEGPTSSPTATATISDNGDEGGGGEDAMKNSTEDATGDLKNVTQPPGDGTVPPTTPTLSVIQGQVDVELKFVAGPMADETKEFYEAQTTAFLAAGFRGRDPPVTAERTEVISQEFEARRRDLLDRLTQAQASEEGNGNNVGALLVTLRVTGGQEQPNFTEFSNMVTDAINANSDGYISYLSNSTKYVDQLYFSTVESAVASAYAASSPSGPPPTPGPPASAPGTGEGDAQGGGALSGGAIAGIVIGVVIFVILVGVGGYYLYVTVLSKGGGSSSNRAVAVPSRSEDAGDDGGGDSLSTDVNSKQVLQPSRQMKKDALSGNDSIDQDSLLAGYSGPDPKPFDLESQGQDTASLVAMEDAGSNMGTSASLVEDNMSYAYSLDAGNVGGGGTTVGDGDSTARETTGGRRYSRKVIAPSGKLGIIIDTTLEGPVVHKIQDSSPLLHIIYPGDIIVAIDDVDTRAMSASSITALMVRTASQNRTLTVISDDPNR